MRIALTDGAFHAVDSSELAFKLASVYAFRAAYAQAAPTVLEPVMMVEVTVPGESQVGRIAFRERLWVAAVPMLRVIWHHGVHYMAAP